MAISSFYDGEISLWDISSEKWKRLDSIQIEGLRYGRLYIHKDKVLANAFAGEGCLSILKITEDENKKTKLNLENHFKFKQYKFQDPMWTNDGNIFGVALNNKEENSSHVNKSQIVVCPVCNKSFKNVGEVEQHVERCLQNQSSENDLSNLNLEKNNKIDEINWKRSLVLVDPNNGSFKKTNPLFQKRQTSCKK
eukprot:TRINITY_DN6991_c0_g1_i1.p1 TRINITY_DN6991_c0_g1~~TRINITY_DN6991_c0_g1_i1.p1  ORF type:complete len:194 (+),score=41.17 TRINITY_DN6991_c0_g1_i1:191-772(+)